MLFRSVTVGLDYNDTSGHTTGIDFYVRDKNKVTTYLEHIGGPIGFARPNVTITLSPNQVWYWGFNATCTDFEKNVTADLVLRTETRIVNLPIPDFFQNFMSVGLIILIAGLASPENRRQIMLFVAFFGVCLTGIGVFPAMNNIIGWALLMMALVLAAAYYMKKGEILERV